MSRIPDSLGLRKDGRDAPLAQREVDRLHAEQLVKQEKFLLDVGEQIFAGHGATANSSLTADQIYLIALRPPEKRVGVKSLRFYVNLAGASPSLEVALFRSNKGDKTLRQIPGSYLKYAAVAAGAYASDVNYDILPDDEPLFLGYRRTGGTSLVLRGYTLQVVLTVHRQLATATTWPRVISWDSAPLTGLTSCGTALFLTTRMNALV